MTTNDPAQEEAKLVLDIYDHAISHGLNVTNREDVVTIMKSLNQEDYSDDHLDRLMQALEITANRIQTDVANRKKYN